MFLVCYRMRPEGVSSRFLEKLKMKAYSPAFAEILPGIRTENAIEGVVVIHLEIPCNGDKSIST